MKKTRLFVLLLCISSLFLLSGCESGSSTNIVQTPKQVTEYQNTNEKPQSGGTLRLAMTGAASLNPVLADNLNNLYVLRLVFDGLFTVAPDDSIEPSLCESYVIQPDGIHYELTVKSGVSFHNGTKLTAQDVDATLTFLQQNEGLLQNSLADIAEHRAEGMKLYITLKQPVINFPALLTFPVLSAADLSASPAEYIPNGTGRYKVQSYQKSKTLYLSANENYHEAFAPYITNIEVSLLKDAATAVTMLENLQIDLLPSDVINLREYTPKRNLSSAEFFRGQFTFLGVNNQRPALLSSLTRTALAVSLDKAGLLNAATVKSAKPVDLPFAPASCWNNGQLSDITYDAGYARSLLADAGWAASEENGILTQEIYGEKTKLDLEILVNRENQTRQRLAAQIKDYFAAAGVASHVTSVSFEEYERRVAAKQFDLVLGSVSLSENYDPSFLFKTDNNPFGISIEDVDQTLNALALKENTSQKQLLYYELDEVLKTEMPMITLYAEYNILVFDSRLKGEIIPSGTDIFYGIERWFWS